MADTILEVRNITKCFNSKKVSVKALTDVSFDIGKGETIGIVGESGCGKTTLGRCIVRAIEATSGNVYYTTEDGRRVDFLKVSHTEMKKIRKDIQMIFQDPYSSLDPRMTVLDIISEPLKANFPKMSKAELEARVVDIAGKTGLNTSYLKRYPHAFSGGAATEDRHSASFGSAPEDHCLRRSGIRFGRIHTGSGHQSAQGASARDGSDVHLHQP